MHTRHCSVCGEAKTLSIGLVLVVGERAGMIGQARLRDEQRSEVPRCEDVRCGSSCFAPRLPQRKPGALLLLTPKEANCPRRGCTRLSVSISPGALLCSAACWSRGPRRPRSLIPYRAATLPSGVFLDVTVEPARAPVLSMPAKQDTSSLAALAEHAVGNNDAGALHVVCRVKSQDRGLQQADLKTSASRTASFLV